MSTENTTPVNGTNGEGTTPSASNGTTPNSTAPSASAAPAPAAAPTREVSAQDAEEAAAISQVRKLVGVVQKDADMAPLREKGFDAQNLSSVIALCDTADEKFDGRQQAMAAQLAQTAEVNSLFDDAVKEYADFRETARTVFSDDGSRKALKVSDAVPDSLENFLTDARSAYTTAKKKPYVTALAKKGYDAETLDEKLAALEALREADEEQARTTGDAKKATSERRLAVAPIQKFRSDVRRVARRVFRKQPEQLAKLDF